MCSSDLMVKVVEIRCSTLDRTVFYKDKSIGVERRIPNYKLRDDEGCDTPKVGITGAQMKRR